MLKTQVAQLDLAYERSVLDARLLRNEAAWKLLSAADRELCKEYLPSFARLGSGTFRDEWRPANAIVSSAFVHAKALLERGKLAAELELFELASDDLTRAIDGVDPGVTAEALYQRGEARLRHGDLKEARADFDKVLVKPGPFEGLSRLALARCHLSANNLEGVLTECDTLLKGKGDNVEALLIRAEAYRKRELPEKAGADVGRAEKLRPFAAATQIGRAGLLSDEKKFDEAEAVLAKAIDIEPGEPRIYSARSGLYKKMGREVDAKSDAATAEKLRRLALGRWH